MAVNAIIGDRYGPMDVLELREIDQPAIGDRDVLVRVRAAGLHPGDCFAVKGSPFPVRLMTGLRRPKYGVPGLDAAGIVEAVGSRVTRVRPGDEVFGVVTGACARFARAEEADLVAKPAGLSFGEAAAIPTSALAALHGLRDAGRVQAGQKLLINGASGGVGTFAVQIGKALGAEVTGVCGTPNVELVRSIGADHVIDYTREDFTKGSARYDVILDNVENRSLADCRRALTPSGTLVLNSGTGAGGLALLIRLVRPLVLSPFGRQKMRRYLSQPRADDLAFLAGLANEGKLRPVIGRTFPLEETPAALRHIETGHARGKVVVTVAA
jgi:NADPH:quinone reductase-like Zn-dependent oxidoreductase